MNLEDYFKKLHDQQAAHEQDERERERLQNDGSDKPKAAPPPADDSTESDFR